MSDVISRQAAKDMIKNHKSDFSTEKDYRTARACVNAVPPAQLGTNLAEVGTDCISRQDALEAFGLSEKTRKYGGDHSGYDTMMMYEIQDTIEDLPPIQPDIVRCKDCKHWIPYDWMFSEVWQSKNIADYPEDEIGCNYCDMAMKANDFCSRGERREDG